MDKQDKKKKSLENSLVGISLGHAALCPIHGILPKIALIAGSGGSLGETKLGKAGAWIHEKEEDGLAYVISKFHRNPYEEHHCSTEDSYHSHTCEHHHKNNYSEKVLNQAHFGVHALNWLLIGYSAYIIGKRIYNKVTSKTKKHCHE